MTIKNRRSKKDLLFFYSGCTASRRMPKTRRSKKPTRPFPRTTTTFMPKHSFQRWANVKPMATMMTAAKNSVSPYGQKQERVSPKPNAVAQRPHRRHTGRGTQCCFMVFAPFPSHCIRKGAKRFRRVFYTRTVTGFCTSWPINAQALLYWPLRTSFFKFAHCFFRFTTCCANSVSFLSCCS